MAASLPEAPAVSVAGEAREQRIGGLEPQLICGVAAGEAQLLRAIQAVVLGRFADELEDALRIDAGVRPELDHAAQRPHLKTYDAERHRAQLERGDPEQCLCGRWQGTEAIDHLALQVLERSSVGGRRDALVLHEPQMHVREVVLGQQRWQVQVEFRAGIQRALEIRFLAGLKRSDRALKQVEIEGKADLGDLTALFLAQQLAGAADLEVVCGERKPAPSSSSDSIASRRLRASWLRAASGGAMR